MKPGGSLKIGVGAAVAAGLIAFPLVGGLATAGAALPTPPGTCTPEVFQVHGVGGANREIVKVDIRGVCFNTSSPANSVMFGSVPASFTIKTDATIVAIPPPQAAGTVPVTVSSADGGTSKVTAGSVYTYYVPRITSLSPNKGTVLGGNTIVIRGDHLAAGGTPTVSFAGTNSSSVTVVNDRALKVVVPAHAAPGKAAVVVTTTEGASAGTTNYTYVYRA